MRSSAVRYFRPRASTRVVSGDAITTFSGSLQAAVRGAREALGAGCGRVRFRPDVQQRVRRPRPPVLRLLFRSCVPSRYRLSVRRRVPGRQRPAARPTSPGSALFTASRSSVSVRVAVSAAARAALCVSSSWVASSSAVAVASVTASSSSTRVASSAARSAARRSEASSNAARQISPAPAGVSLETLHFPWRNAHGGGCPGIHRVRFTGRGARDERLGCPETFHYADSGSGRDGAFTPACRFGPPDCRFGHSGPSGPSRFGAPDCRFGDSGPSARRVGP